MRFSLNVPVIMNSVMGASYNDVIENDYEGRLLKDKESEIDEQISDMYYNEYTTERDPVKKMELEVGLIARMIAQRSLYYVPVDTGSLKKSIYMRQIGKGIEVGYKKEYAVYVHENPINYHESPTRYKFLEDAAYEILNETKSTLDVYIEYEPLAVYINYPRGERLQDKKEKTKEEIKFVQEFMSLADSVASENS